MANKEPNDVYVERMQVWIEQQQICIRDCKESRVHLLQKIAIDKELLSVNRRQETLILRAIRNAEKNLKDHLA